MFISGYFDDLPEASLILKSGTYNKLGCGGSNDWVITKDNPKNENSLFCLPYIGENKLYLFDYFTTENMEDNQLYHEMVAFSKLHGLEIHNTELEFIFAVLTDKDMKFYDDATEKFDYSNGFWQDEESNLMCCVIKKNEV